MERRSDGVVGWRAKATNQYSSTPLLHYSVPLFFKTHAIVCFQIIYERGFRRVEP
jgi:hypothetical protein